jgi:hypothetical protein
MLQKSAAGSRLHVEPGSVPTGGKATEGFALQTSQVLTTDPLGAKPPCSSLDCRLKALQADTLRGCSTHPRCSGQRKSSCFGGLRVSYRIVCSAGEHSAPAVPMLHLQQRPLASRGQVNALARQRSTRRRGAAPQSSACSCRCASGVHDREQSTIALQQPGHCSAHSEVAF